MDNIYLWIVIAITVFGLTLWGSLKITQRILDKQGVVRQHEADRTTEQEREKMATLARKVAEDSEEIEKRSKDAQKRLEYLRTLRGEGRDQS